MRRIHHAACTLCLSACWTSSAPPESPEPVATCDRSCVEQKLPPLRAVLPEVTAQPNYNRAAESFAAGDLATGIQYVRVLQKQFPYSKYRELAVDLTTKTYATALESARASCATICDDCGCSDGICEASCRKRFAIHR